MPYRLLILIAICGIAFCAGCPTATKKESVAFTPNQITLKDLAEENIKELVDAQLKFVDKNGAVWVAPQGTRTDGASVPRLALIVTDGRFDSEFLKAAVVHDAYCQTINEKRCPKQYRTRTWRTVHRMFYEACLAGGTSKTKAKLMFAGVWLGGPRWDDPEHDLDAVPDEDLKKEFEACKKWMKENDPSPQEIEAWMDKREPKLLAKPFDKNEPSKKQRP